MYGTTCWPWASIPDRSRLGYDRMMTSRWRVRTELWVHTGVEMAARGIRYLVDGHGHGVYWWRQRSTSALLWRILIRVRCTWASPSCELGHTVLLASLSSTQPLYLPRSKSTSAVTTWRAVSSTSTNSSHQRHTRINVTSQSSCGWLQQWLAEVCSRDFVVARLMQLLCLLSFF